MSSSPLSRGLQSRINDELVANAEWYIWLWIGQIDDELIRLYHRATNIYNTQRSDVQRNCYRTKGSVFLSLHHA